MRRLLPVVWLLLCMLPVPALACKLLVVGDSLSAAYGMQVSAGWVAQLSLRLAANNPDCHVINASISGDTTANGLARLPTLLDTHHPDIVIIELGGNDGLRGLSLAQMRQNIETMIEKARAIDARVLLVGVRLPPNYGKTYTEKFHQVYPDIAARLHVPLVPFILDGIATDRGLMQQDGIHPDAAAQGRMLENVWTVLAEML